MVSLALTYLLWICGGWFGLHHLYLGRVYHAFVWFSTLGGVFGLGWFRELWRLPEYVSISNADKTYQMLQLSYISRHPRPSGGIVRLCGMFVMGILMSSVLCGIIPSYEEDGSYGYYLFRGLSTCLILIGSSFGVYVVSNVGDIQCRPEYPILGALMSTPWLLFHPSNISMAVILSALVSWWFGLRWRPVNPLKNNRAVKCVIYVALITAWVCLVGYVFYFNVTVGVGDERVPLRVALGNFFSSPAWKQTKQAFEHLYAGFEKGGWEEAYYTAGEMFDLSGEAAAFATLGIPRTSTKGQISKMCRKLLAQTHPDRFKTDEEKATAQETFIKYQEACSVLSGSKYKGMNSHDDDEFEDQNDGNR